MKINFGTFIKAKQFITVRLFRNIIVIIFIFFLILLNSIVGFFGWFPLFIRNFTWQNRFIISLFLTFRKTHFRVTMQLKFVTMISTLLNKKKTIAIYRLLWLPSGVKWTILLVFSGEIKLLRTKRRSIKKKMISTGVKIKIYAFKKKESWYSWNKK